MTDTLTFASFTPDHLDGALRLSRAADWPHRRADWDLVLGLSQGVVALEGERVVGTAIATAFGPVAFANMIIVDAAMRGRGLGRSLMERMMALAAPQEWRLTATAEGFPLYQKLGFEETGQILQLQGPVAAINPPDGVEWATPADLPAIVALDRQATGADRTALLTRLAEVGRIAVIREAGGLAGFATLRAFGRGEVAGPVVARSDDEAKLLFSFLFSTNPGGFLRADIPQTSGLAAWLQGMGLALVGGGITMRRGGPVVQPAPQHSFHTHALAAQALG